MSGVVIGHVAAAIIERDELEYQNTSPCALPTTCEAGARVARARRNVGATLSLAPNQAAEVVTLRRASGPCTQQPTLLAWHAREAKRCGRVPDELPRGLTRVTTTNSEERRNQSLRRKCVPAVLTGLSLLMCSYNPKARRDKRCNEWHAYGCAHLTGCLHEERSSKQ